MLDDFLSFAESVSLYNMGSILNLDLKPGDSRFFPKVLNSGAGIVKR